MKKLSRRLFLQSTSGALGYLALRGILRPSLVFAQGAGGVGRNVILVNLIGGYDGLTHYPYVEGATADTIRQLLRPGLQIPASQVLQPHPQNGLSNKIGFHPAWARLAGNPLAQGISLPGEANGNISVIKTVGYASSDPGRSHDFCQNLYSIGRRGQGQADRKGWLARFMDTLSWEPLQVYGIGSGSKLDLNAEKQKPVIVGRLSDFNYTARNFGSGSFRRQEGSGSVSASSTNDSAYARMIAQEILQSNAPKDELIRLLHQADQTAASAVSFIAEANSVPLSGLYQSYAVNYLASPHNYSGVALQGLSSFQRNCQDSAKVLIRSAQSSALSNRTKVIYLQRGGWDTHSAQRGSIGGMIADVAAGLSGLVADLKIAGLWQDTAICLFSEFGRTNFENSADLQRAGTDHGYANFHLVLGGAVNHGPIGDDPTPEMLVNRNFLQPSVDFRQVISEIFSWAGVSNATISQVFNEPYPTKGALGLFG